MRRKKNGFFTFIWSFMPGAAEMYMGFMKCGISLMVLFLGGFMLSSLIRIGDVMLFLPILVWFYSFNITKKAGGFPAFFTLYLPLFPLCEDFLTF